ncbi:hypothetical protein F5878DRAFT_432977 [Lentinula raphanica]|uniref:Secreted protein n=1 Tax=Lentinula raphanica TaxID=153919 RepID=A0AA38PFG5_9AGAR|nr:hypothetical protein F5880DRAFT_630546 [Lentinula raphanica]KAJ3841955.1 hypothetical protein F5878DRAFT_432977 [Lentinula raphanica]
MTRSTTASRVLAIFFVAAAISSGVLAAPTPAPGPSLESSIDASAQALQAWQHSATDGQGSLSSVGGAGLQQGVNPILHRRELDEENVGRTPMNMGQAEGSTSTAGTQPKSLQELEGELKECVNSFHSHRVSFGGQEPEGLKEVENPEEKKKNLDELYKKVAGVIRGLEALPNSRAKEDKLELAKRLQLSISSDISIVRPRPSHPL